KSAVVGSVVFIESVQADGGIITTGDVIVQAVSPYGGVSRAGGNTIERKCSKGRIPRTGAEPKQCVLSLGCVKVWVTAIRRRKNPECRRGRGKRKRAKNKEYR